MRVNRVHDGIIGSTGPAARLHVGKELIVKAMLRCPAFAGGTVQPMFRPNRIVCLTEETIETLLAERLRLNALAELILAAEENCLASVSLPSSAPIARDLSLHARCDTRLHPSWRRPTMSSSRA